MFLPTLTYYSSDICKYFFYLAPFYAYGRYSNFEVPTEPTSPSFPRTSTSHVKELTADEPPAYARVCHFTHCLTTISRLRSPFPPTIANAKQLYRLSTVGRSPSKNIATKAAKVSRSAMEPLPVARENLMCLLSEWSDSKNLLFPGGK